jgi:hypothetical protein
LVLRDGSGEDVVPSAAGPRLIVHSSRPTSYRITSAPSDAPWTLVLGQAYDARWHARLDGADLGPTQVVDGYSAGWTVDDPGPHEITITYGTQRPADAALAVSGLGALAVVGLLTVPAMRDRFRPTAPPEPRPVPARDHRAVRTRLPGRRQGWLLVVAAAFLTGGWWLALVAAGLAAWDLFRRPRATTVVLAGVGCWVALPVAWYTGNAGRWGEVTPELVTGNPWPHVLGYVGLLLVVVGVVRHEVERPSGTLGRHV